MSRKPVRFNVNPLLSGPSLDARARSGSPYRELSLDDVDVDPNQPRREFDQESLAELAASIKEYGVICPILVRVSDNGTYRLVAGERRLRASRLIGLKSIPAIIDSGEGVEDVLAKQLVENIQRADLNPMERAIAFGRMRDSDKLSVREIGAKLGVSKSLVQRSLEILDLPDDLQHALLEGAPESKVLALASVEDRETRQSLLAQLADLTRDQIEEAVKHLHDGGSSDDDSSHRGTASAKAESEVSLRPDDLRISEELRRQLGLKVQIARKKGNETQGRLQIDFYSEDDLKELYRRLAS